MTDARKWWVGLAPLAALWVAGNWFGTDHVEKDLAARAAAAVEQAGGSVQPPRIEARGRDISVATIAADPAAANRIGTAILQQTGVRLVDVGGMALPPLARPFPFAATREGATLTLTGSVPSEAVRLKIVDAAKAIPAVTVVDRLTVARGAPDGFETMALHGLAQAARLSSGTFQLSDGAYSLKGVAGEAAGVGVIAVALKQVPGGASVALADIAPPQISPFTWSASVGGQGGPILSGFAPDEATRAVLSAAAAKAFGTTTIANTIQIARGAPAGFAGVAGAAIDALSKFVAGRATLSDMRLTIEGQGRDGVDVEALLASLKGVLPAGFVLAADGVTMAVVAVVPPPPPVAPAPEPVASSAPPALEALAPLAAASAPPPSIVQTCSAAAAPLANATLHFEPGSRVLNKGEAKALDAVLEAASRCVDARVFIVGHTDSRGSRAANISLSSRRAFTASNYLIARGVRRARISTLGYGEDRRVVVDDATDAQRAINRRVVVEAR